MMKKYLIIITGLFLFCSAFGQTPIEVTPEMQRKIKLNIEKDAINLKKQLEKANENEVVVEFRIDTFKIERFMEEYIKLDFSTAGMRESGYHAASAYDTLLNKYYKKLLAILKGDDKKILIQAQKAWITFRDSETKLVEVISKDEYSGGGTMQQLTESSMYLDLIKNRLSEIFSHFTRAT